MVISFLDCAAKLSPQGVDILLHRRILFRRYTFAILLFAPAKPLSPFRGHILPMRHHLQVQGLGFRVYCMLGLGFGVYCIYNARAQKATPFYIVCTFSMQP